MLYFHGGGWVIADLDTYDATPRAIAAQSHAIVVSAHYRQAPEHRLPAAHDDAFSAWHWLVENAASLGGDPEKLAVMGESGARIWRSTCRSALAMPACTRPCIKR